MEHQLLIGKYTLESLTSGLYVSPLDLYREYIQNAADSIDEAIESIHYDPDKATAADIETLKEIQKLVEKAARLAEKTAKRLA